MGKKQPIEEKLTLAQELERILDEQDDSAPGMTVRQALCRSLIEQAKTNLKTMQWIYEISGEKRREYRRLNPGLLSFD